MKLPVIPVTHTSGPYVQDGDRAIFMAKRVARAGDDETVIYLNGNPGDHRMENLKVVKTKDLRSQEQH